jgi:hypothetical protein
MGDKQNMDIECPHCHVEFKLDHLQHTLKNGHFECLVCGKKFLSPLSENHIADRRYFSVKHVLTAILILGVLVAAVFVFINLQSNTTMSPQPQATNKLPAGDPLKHSPHPSNTQVSSPTASSQSPGVLPDTNIIAQAGNAPPPGPPDKLQIVQKIAAQFHKTHTYTMEGDFVCLDMAIDVWNQLVTNGIETKIMGGTVQENVTAWNYKQLVQGSNHAWVIARLSATDKVAIETTAGVVIKPGMNNSAAYFKGVEFDNPSQIKKFDSLRKKIRGFCNEAREMMEDWNSNVVGKQKASRETIEKKARIEQRMQDCEKTWNDLDEFKSRAIFY